MKPRKKKFIRQSKNGTIFYINKYGDRWYNCEPFKILYVKHNQYLISRDGSGLKISQMNEGGYEFSAYLFEDVKKDGYVDKYKLEEEMIEFYKFYIKEILG